MSIHNSLFFEENRNNTGRFRKEIKTMENTFEIRTDLAVEEKESFPGDGGEISGVSLREWRRPDSRIKVTEVKILDKKGEKAMKKPMGTYITLEADELSLKDEDYHREVSQELAKQIEKLVKI